MGTQGAAPVVVAAALLLGCGSDRAGTGGGWAPVAEVDTVGARVEVANTGVPGWGPDGAWRVEEELRLGTSSSDRPVPDQFGDIASLTVDSRGRIYVLDGLARRIRVFRPDGTFSHTLGGPGEGPGELAYASALTMGPGDTLTMLDDGSMRYTVYAPDGTVVAVHRRALVGRNPHLRPGYPPGVGYLDWWIAQPDGRMGERVLFHPVRYTADFGRADTLPPVTLRRTMVPDGSLPLLQLGGGVVATVDDDGGLWVADSRAYRVARRTLGGDTTVVVTLPATPAPIGEAERLLVRERFAGRPGILDDQLGALPATKPVLHALVADGAGHLYVFPELADAPAGSVVDVFRSSGLYLGRIGLPTPLAGSDRAPPVVHLTADHLYGVVKDALDVPYVVRLRIIRPEPGR